MFEIEKECYEQLAVKLADILQGIDGHEFMIKKRFGGEMKFIEIMYGIMATNGKHPCPWCTCDKND